MATLNDDIKRWIEEGLDEGASEFLIVSDGFSYEYYPVFIFDITKKIELISKYNTNMQRVKESINILEYCKQNNIKIPTHDEPESLNVKILNPDFVKRMENELQDNAEKGVWKDWHPTKEEWLWEMQHHIAKLQHAISNQNTELVKEFSADIANLAEKSFTEFGERNMEIRYSKSGKQITPRPRPEAPERLS